MSTARSMWRTLPYRARGARKPFFATNDVRVGEGSSFGRNVRFNCRSVRIGRGVQFQDDITIDAEHFSIGDYGTLYRGFFSPGPGVLQIGHNFWAGTNTIVDAQGTTSIGPNVGVGAHSQLWTHMAFGDTLVGSRFHSVSPLAIGHDVWFVGHCLVSPVTASPFSLAMLGSLVTRDMAPNRVYAGAPAKDVTDRLGPQAVASPPMERAEELEQRISAFASARGLSATDLCEVVVDDQSAIANARRTTFDVAHRNYSGPRGALETELLRHLLPDAKFVPYPERCDGPPTGEGA